MTEEASESPAQPSPAWETWSKVAMALTLLVICLWAVVLLRLGINSVQAHAALPYAGALTLVVLAWGLVRTLLNPPVVRRSRTIAFFSCLFAGSISTQPIVSAPLSTEDFVSTHTYRLPVDGDWMVIAGGRDRSRNVHATFPPTRWGFDFTRVEGGKKFALDGKKASDYHCFGQPVVSPVAGKVVHAEGHHVDNPPGQVSPSSVLGNYVIISPGPDEYAFLAHLAKSSIVVAIGDQVQAGEPIGKCGNSGRSPEPHVHFHVQDRVEFPIAQGLPIEFSDYDVKNGKSTSRGMPYGESSVGAMDGLIVRSR